MDEKEEARVREIVRQEIKNREDYRDALAGVRTLSAAIPEESRTPAIERAVEDAVYYLTRPQRHYGTDRFAQDQGRPAD